MLRTIGVTAEVAGYAYIRVHSDRGETVILDIEKAAQVHPKRLSAVLCAWRTIGNVAVVGVGRTRLIDLLVARPAVLDDPAAKIAAQCLEVWRSHLRHDHFEKFRTFSFYVDLAWNREPTPDSAQRVLTSLDEPTKHCARLLEAYPEYWSNWRGPHQILGRLVTLIRPFLYGNGDLDNEEILKLVTNAAETLGSPSDLGKGAQP